jgi:GT2 family glycosyltransferase
MLYILLPVFNRSKITQSFVRQLKVQSFQDFQLVLIDDASTDDTVSRVVEILPNTIVLNGGGDAWWAGSLQLGFEYLMQQDNHSYDVLLINDDTAFENNFLEVGVRALQAHPDKIIKATEIEKNNLQPPFRFVFANLRLNKFIETEDENLANCTTTRGLFIAGNTFRNIGGFYPRRLPHYLSDYEYTIRASLKGFKIYCPKDLTVEIDMSTTGLFKPKYININQYFSDLFSNRNMVNPKQKIQFVLLTQTNIFLKVRHILKIVLIALKDLGEALYLAKVKNKYEN